MVTVVSTYLPSFICTFFACDICPSLSFNFLKKKKKLEVEKYFYFYLFVKL